jgi:predicted enzyme related to lactoylglutathione lyase
MIVVAIMNNQKLEDGTMGTTRKTGCSTEATSCSTEAAGATQEACCTTGDLMGHGAPSWIELNTSDVAAAQKFYGALFGWTTEAFEGAGGMPYQILSANGQPRGGIFSALQCGEGPAMPPHWGIVIAVDCVDTVVKQVTDLGGKVLMPPTDIPTIGRYATIQDPQGAVISAITYLKK